MKIIAIFAICTSLRMAAAAPSPTEKFDHNMTIVADQYFLHWTVKGDEITFQARVKTLGYIGLGISPNGGMAGSDIVTAWVKDDKVYFQDRHATGNSQPKLDEEQNWFLIEGMEKDGYTIVTFKRPLISCDRVNDLDINGETIRLIYAYHPEDPKDAASIVYHGNQRRGSKSVTLLLYGSQKTVSEIPPHTGFFDFVLPPTEVPAAPTTYWCHAFKMPEMEEKHQIVRFEPLIEPGHEGIAHHIVLYTCAHDFDEDAHEGMSAECYKDLMGEVSKCTGMLYAWAIGGSAFNFPEHAGYAIGGDTKLKMIRFEIHYDNPSSQSGIIDSSGIRMYYTNKLREFDAGYVGAGSGTLDLVIPPSFETLTTRSHCSQQCLEKAIPKGQDIKIFASLLHAHLLGTRIRVRHFRDGVELPNIAKDDHYDFNYQDIRVLPKEVSVKPSDHLMVECDYKSSHMENVTFGGSGTNDEMCLAFLSYYPKRPLSRCVSVDFPTKFAKVVNATLEFDEDARGFRRLFSYNITAPEKYAYKDMSTVMNMVDWEDSAMRERFQTVIQEEDIPMIQLCDDGDLHGLMKNPLIQSPRIKQRYEASPPQCSPTSAGFMVQGSMFLIFFALKLTGCL